jgi:hypothetical protein
VIALLPSISTVTRLPAMFRTVPASPLSMPGFLSVLKNWMRSPAAKASRPSALSIS